ncbi:HlyD family secretion protein [Anaerovorax sp. IOR16]|uniref:HlyD family secretion protein n=1 Tax=Anaerovorax sp. IOR16 TaxID=2773458 RepID=UPI0019D187A0|nr:HlyD family efflux transporter periplasmic adaptor subunit [Anaerovorax sp. IOR16]
MHANKKKIVAIILFVVIFGSIGYLSFGKSAHYIGTVEANPIVHVSEVSGKILEFPVELGSKVKKGDVIAIIDSETQQYRIEQLELKIKKAKIDSSSLKLGGGSSADNRYEQAKANYEGAVAIARKASEDYSKAQTLYKQAAIAKEELEKAELNHQTAQSSLQVAEAQLAQAKDRTLENAADIDIALLESQLEEQKEKLKKYTVTASCDGVIMSKNYSEGDVVQSGFDLADISPMTEKYAVVYYPKEAINDLTYDQKVTVVYNKKKISGTIKYIDVKAQYTPKDFQTAANKNVESVKVKILLPVDCSINPGQQVEITLE